MRYAFLVYIIVAIGSTYLSPAPLYQRPCTALYYRLCTILYIVDIALFTKRIHPLFPEKAAYVRRALTMRKCIRSCIALRYCGEVLACDPLSFGKALSLTAPRWYSALHIVASHALSMPHSFLYKCAQLYWFNSTKKDALLDVLYFVLSSIHFRTSSGVNPSWIASYISAIHSSSIASHLPLVMRLL